MNELHNKPNSNDLLHFVAEMAKRKSHAPSAPEASPQEIGHVVEQYAKQSSDANADERPILDRILHTQEGSLFLIGLFSLSAGLFTSEAGREFLKRMSHQ